MPNAALIAIFTSASAGSNPLSPNLSKNPFGLSTSSCVTAPDKISFFSNGSTPKAPVTE